MSLVVMIVGQATLVPALEPMYGMPSSQTRFLIGSMSARS